MDIEEEQRRFLTAIAQVEWNASERCGIGTLGEKTLHAVCKYYMEPDPSYHEVPSGRYYADIAREGLIVEIQTRSFDRLRDKLTAFLSEGYVVNVVYPVPAVKWLSWIDPEDGSVSARRKSPRKGRVYDIVPELYRLKNQLSHPNLDFTVLLLEVQDIRLLNGWSRDRKKGSERFERIPIALLDRVTFGQRDGFDALIPDGLPEEFRSKDFAAAAHIEQGRASTLLSILSVIGTLHRVGKSGRMYLYSRTARKEESVGERE